MITNIEYKGPYLTASGLPDECRHEGIVPAHSGSIVQLSKDRWIFFCTTLDTRGWDSVGSIVYQLRKGAPDGDVLTNGVIQKVQSGWDPLNMGISLRKCHGMPVCFGVPKGAQYAGKVYPNHNVFVVKWYTLPMLEDNGRIWNPGCNAKQWPEGADIQHRLLRVEWMQFRLNDREDDIEVLLPKQKLYQKGYSSDDEFCSLGPDHHHNHAMSPPVPDDESCMRWYEVDTFKSIPSCAANHHGMNAPIEFTFNLDIGLYEWTRTGALYGLGELVIGESSISRFGDQWLIACRGFNNTIGNTFWFRTTDLMNDFKTPFIKESNCHSPRHSYRCADGQLRLFINNNLHSPYEGGRNPLFVHDVDNASLDYSEPVVVMDAFKSGVPFEEPFVDMAKLSGPVGNKQYLVFRTIDHWMTSERSKPSTIPLARNLAAAGVHYAEIEYDDVSYGQWQFADE